MGHLQTVLTGRYREAGTPTGVPGMVYREVLSPGSSLFNRLLITQPRLSPVNIIMLITQPRLIPGTLKTVDNSAKLLPRLTMFNVDNPAKAPSLNNYV